MADTVLILEAEEPMRTMLYQLIRSAGLEVQAVSTGEQALEWIRQQPFDLILTEINLGGMDGFQVIETIRSRGIKTPVIIVSERNGDCDALYGLNIGADDYITKPFNPAILAAKVKALIRRSRGGLSGGEAAITAGPFRYDTSTLRLYKNGQEIILSAKENAMMKLFLDNVNRIFSKNLLYELIWGEAIVDENAIMVYINRLRQKIEENPSCPQYIQTVRGLGYRFVVG